MPDYRAILQQYWGYADFRDLQYDIITSIGSGKDTLGLMPTGGGKSITFQVPALAQEGLCLVITPLIALMKDQVNNLQAKNIKAAAIYSGMENADIQKTFDNCIYGHYKFLYLSPERLSTRLFLEKLPLLSVSLIAVDEAHCISQWGYDFRPSYREIAHLRQLLPGVPILAVTATATPQVVYDIQRQLQFKHINVLRKSFYRPNLSYSVRQTEDKQSQLLRILNNVPGSSVVYVRNRKKTKDTAEFLQQNGISAHFFHAGLPLAQKDERQKQWKKGECRVMVATNAFGMGIDKSDVRSVIHLDMPDSIEAYFQEAGRAGRDEKKAYCVLVFNNTDVAQAKKRIKEAFPEKEFIVQVYEQLAYYLQVGVGSCKGSIFNFQLSLFCSKFRLPIQITHSALKILELAGYIEYHDELEFKARIQVVCPRHRLYELSLHPIAEKVLNTLLRTYTGIFAELTPIDEDAIATYSNMSTDSVKQGLIALYHEHIITYIPHQKSPCIIYTKERIETNRLRIEKEVYENRKRRFEHRIEAMIRYATDNEHCRSQLLLSYFGEEDSKPCNQCDHCLKTPPQTNDIAAYLTSTLAKQPMSLNELMQQASFPGTTLIETIRMLIDKGEIIHQNNLLQLKS